MNKITYMELKNTFCEFNDNKDIRTKGNKDIIRGVIVFKSENWPNDNFSLEARSYRVSSDNKAFISGMGGYSIFGSSLDGSDPCVRLERYIEDEYGTWKVDYCYLLEEEN